MIYGVSIITVYVTSNSPPLHTIVNFPDSTCPGFSPFPSYVNQISTGFPSNPCSSRCTRKEEGYTSNEVAVIQKAQSSNEFKETVRKTKLGRLMEITGTAKYNIDNENISNDTFNCVNKKELKETNKLKLKFRVRVDKDKVITIWECQGKEVSYYYVDNATKGLTQEYFFDFEYQKGNNKHITQLNPYTIKELELNNKLGYIYFNNPETKYLFNQINLFFKN